MVASRSRTQKSIALSSCEGELVAATMGATEGILMKEILRFLLSVELKIVEPELESRLDSSSARQWLQQAGVGRLKHLASRSLWLQDAVREKTLYLRAIPAAQPK